MLKIITSPDPLLNQVCEPCEPGDKSLKKLAKQMERAMYASDGVGIAAPQVGLNRRLIVVCRLDLPGEPFEAYANVQIDSLWGEDLFGREGCLSIPGLRGNVCRKEFAAVSYTDPTSLERRSEVVSGYVARIFQHETDHLAGTLYTDRTGEVWEVEE